MTCNICGNEVKLKFVAKGFDFLQCKNCSFIQVDFDPSKAELGDIYSDDYFTHAKYKDISTLNRENKRRLSIAKRFIKDKSKKVLDAGCASGEFLAYAEGSYDFWGIDISEFAVNEAKKRIPSMAHQLSFGLIEDQDYNENFFDGIIMWDVIEHIKDPLATCKSLLKFIKPGGYLMVSTPNIGAAFAKICGKYWPFITPPEHLSFFNKRSMIQLFEKELDAKIEYRTSKGKWVNIGFLFYKLKRIFPKLVPKFVIKFFGLPVMEKLSIYVPTGDIQYLVIKKNN
jgi:2-polyprenyl-3-methyl-5-hydroxy-6-metoxy-1,4-benzoquinol methylase